MRRKHLNLVLEQRCLSRKGSTRKFFNYQLIQYLALEKELNLGQGISLKLKNGNGKEHSEM